MFFSTLIRPIAPAFVLLAALAGSSVQAQTADGSIRADVSLVTSKSICQGEPIVLKYRISNSSDAQMVLDILVDGPTWLSQSVSDAAGRTIQGHEPVDPNDATAHPGLFNGGVINGQSSFEDYVVANRWFPVLGPGKYTLTVHVSIPYEDVTHTMDEQEFRFPFVVTPVDRARLQATAQTLAEAAAQPLLTEAPKRKMLVSALFSLPEGAAAPTWRKIASSPSSSRALLFDVVTNLGCLQTVTATDILMEMRTNPTPVQDIYLKSNVMAAIAGTYRDGRPQMQEHIRMLYAANGTPLADVVGAPGKAGHGN